MHEIYCIHNFSNCGTPFEVHLQTSIEEELKNVKILPMLINLTYPQV